MKTHILTALFLSLTLCFIACGDDDDDEPQLQANISGTVVYDDRSYEMKGGLIDDQAQRISLNWETLEFNITDLGIDTTRFDTLTIYFSSEERININFKLSARRNVGFLEEGIYTYQSIDPTNDPLPVDQFIFSARIRSGDGSRFTFFQVIEGSLTLSGSLPNYTINFNLIDENARTLTGQVSGRFITRADWP